MSLSKEQRDELRRLHEATTPGPWLTDDGTARLGGAVFVIHQGRREQVAMLTGVPEELGSIAGNAALVAAARNALPALLDAADELEAFMAIAPASPFANDIATQHLWAGFKRALGALADAGSVPVPSSPLYVYEAIERLTAERDKALAMLTPGQRFDFYGAAAPPRPYSVQLPNERDHVSVMMDVVAVEVGGAVVVAASELTRLADEAWKRGREFGQSDTVIAEALLRRCDEWASTLPERHRNETIEMDVADYLNGVTK